MAKCKITMGYDPDTEDPSEYSLFKVVTFNDHRLVTSGVRDRVLACQECGYPDDEVVDGGEHGEAEDVHAFELDPDVLFPIVGGGYDYALTDSYADCDGVLIWNPEPAYRTRAEDPTEWVWWSRLRGIEQADMAIAFLQEYSAWARGDCHWFSIERNPEHVCGECGRLEEPEQVESCGGLIGYEYARTEALDTLAAILGRTPTTDDYDWSYV